MIQNEKVSIIVPIYNGEKFLKECLSTIINQTYSNIEIICLNDGSTDNTDSIIRMFKDKDKRIIYINKKNTGVSNTRNLGIKKASGKYLMFIDIDDIIENNTIEKLINIGDKEESDIVVCTNNLINKKGKERKLNISSIYSEKDNIKNIEGEKTFEYLQDLGVGNQIWNKLIKKDLLIKNNIRFSEKMTYDEDMFFNWKCILYAEKVNLLCEPLYKYRLTMNSAIMKYHEGLIDKYEIAFNEIKTIMIQKQYSCEYINNIIEKIYMKKVQIAIAMVEKSKKKIKEKYKEINYILEHCKKIEKKNSSNLIENMYYKGINEKNAILLILWAKLVNIRTKIARIIK